MVDGLVVIDKPAGMTSHDVVARCRRIFSQKRVGHAGTLDPDATGVLLVGLGSVTRLLQYMSGLPKTYTTEIVLGTATNTLDAAGEVTGTWDMSLVTIDEARRAAEGLTGDILQVPPMVSAVKVGGRRLHELARRGEVVDRPARPVKVYDFSVSPAASEGVLAARIECSSGTYVRVLADDLGRALGGGAHVRLLRREAVGPWTVASAIALDEAGPESVVAPVDALPWMDRLEASAEDVVALSHGRPLARPDGTGPWRVVSPDGSLLAVYEAASDGLARPKVVLASA